MLPPPPRYIPPLGPGKVTSRQRVFAQWRGVDLAPLERAQSMRAQPVSAVLPRVLADLRMDSRRAEAEVVKVWNNLLDPNVIAHAQRVAGNVVEVPDPGFLQTLECGPQRGVVRVVAFALPQHKESVRVAPIFHQHDGRFRMRLTERAHERLDSLSDHFRIHIRQAVQHIDGRIEFGQQFPHDRLHFAAAGEAKIDGGILEAPSEYRAMHHARP